MCPVTITGPSEHPQLGSTLGVDFSPKKVCSFDCVYCKEATTRKTVHRETFYPASEVVSAVGAYVASHGLPKTFFLTGSGEPTLYLGFGEMVRALRDAFPGVACTLYTNGSLLLDPAVRKEIALCDPVMGNLNSVDPATFARIARPHRAVSVDAVVSGYKALRRELASPRLWMDGIFLRGVNDGAASLAALGQALAEIRPDLYTVRTTRRVIPGLCEPVDSAFRETVENAWAGLGLALAFALPPTPPSSAG